MPLARRRHRRWIALIALLGLLFQQLAMATYACPIEQNGAVASGMPACHQSGGAGDKVRCHTHCHPIVAASDHPPAQTVPPAILPPTTWLRSAARHPVVTHIDPTSSVLARATAPPISIQHCTFQI